MIDVRVPNRKLTAKEVEELNLRLNKNLGEWAFDKLANFHEVTLQEVGFSNEELDNIFGLTMDDTYDVDKELERVIKTGQQRTKLGELWELGDHRLFIGDCTDKKSWSSLFRKERFHFLFTDPPYKIGYTQRARKVVTKKGFGYKAHRSYLSVEQRGVPEYDAWLTLAKDYQDSKGANVMVFENWRNTREIWAAIERYWKVRNMVIWHLPNRRQGFSREYYLFSRYDIAMLADKKSQAANDTYEPEFDEYLKMRGQKLLNNYDIAIYGSQNEAYWDIQKKTRWAKVADHVSYTAVTDASSGQGVIFGTKPVQILVPYVKVLSPRGGIVVNCFAGSGSTLIACEIMRRSCRAIELEPIYAEVILRRWEKFTGNKAKRLSNGK